MLRASVQGHADSQVASSHACAKTWHWNMGKKGGWEESVFCRSITLVMYDHTPPTHTHTHTHATHALPTPSLQGEQCQRGHVVCPQDAQALPVVGGGIRLSQRGTDTQHTVCLWFSHTLSLCMRYTHTHAHIHLQGPFVDSVGRRVWRASAVCRLRLLVAGHRHQSLLDSVVAGVGGGCVPQLATVTNTR